MSALVLILGIPVALWGILEVYRKWKNIKRYDALIRGVDELNTIIGARGK